MLLNGVGALVAIGGNAAAVAAALDLALFDASFKFCGVAVLPLSSSPFLLEIGFVSFSVTFSALPLSMIEAVAVAEAAAVEVKLNGTDVLSLALVAVDVAPPKPPKLKPPADADLSLFAEAKSTPAKGFGFGLLWSSDADF